MSIAHITNPVKLSALGKNAIRRLKRTLPEGRALPRAVWEGRHKALLVVLWLHVSALIVFGVYTGNTLLHTLFEVSTVVAAALLAGKKGRSRKVRAAACSVGLVTCSALLVHFSGGYIEMHFHFFVMVILIALYQDWHPFLIAIGYVVLHHGVMGAIDPFSVYNHPEAQAQPWKWAGIHGVFVLAASVASVTSWRLNEKAREHAEMILTAAGEGIFGLDLNGKITFVNPAATQLVGYSAGELIGASAFDILQPVKNSGAPCGREESALVGWAARERVSSVSDEMFRRKDGTRFPVEYVSRPIHDSDVVVGTVVTFRDTTEARKAARELQQSEARFRLLFANNPLPMWLYDLETLRFLEVNDAAVNHYGYSRAEFLRMRITEIRPPEEVPRLLADIASPRPELQSSGPWRHRCKDGRCIDVQISSHEFELGGMRAALVVAEDITRRQEVERQLRHAATHDALTGLANRTVFIESLTSAIARARRHPEYGFAVLFLDLDHFKVINDSLGHLAGDQLLIAIGARLEECMRAGDLLARLGGDEFAILLNHITAEDAVRLAERIQSRLAEPIMLAEHEVSTSASIGIAVSDARYLQPEELLRDADTALYQAKAQGKALCVIFDATMHVRAMKRLQIESELRRGVTRDELRLHYQPIVSLEDGRIVGFEALVRWQHPEKGLIYPEEFIPVAEEAGLLIPIGDWVLREACRQLSKWERQFPDSSELTVSVNLSSKQFSQVGLARRIEQIMAESGVAASQLWLEITESALLDGTERARATIAELRERGHELQIDDFGTGYSSLAYLHRFPINGLKIDRSFIGNVQIGSETWELVRTIVALAHNLGLSVIAEGVETEEMLAHLRDLGCAYAQGYYFSRPLDGLAAGALIEARPFQRQKSVVAGERSLRSAAD